MDQRHEAESGHAALLEYTDEVNVNIRDPQDMGTVFNFIVAILVAASESSKHTSPEKGGGVACGSKCIAESRARLELFEDDGILQATPDLGV